MNQEAVPQINEKKKFWRTDTKALVGAVVMGIVFVLVQQLTVRIDTLLDPSLNLFNGITWAVFTGLIALVYRQPAGLITGEIQAFVCLISGASPLAPFFILANGLGSLAYSAVAQQFSMERWGHHFLAMLACNFVGNIFVSIGLMVVLKLTLVPAILASLLTIAVGTVGGTIIVKPLAGVVKNSGLV